MPIQMTRAEYQAKYGKAPEIPPIATTTSATPVQMTHDQYMAKYGGQTAATETAPALGQGPAGEFAGNVVRSVATPLIRTGGAIEGLLDNTLGRVGNAIAGKGFVPTNTAAAANDTANAADQSASQTLPGQLGSVVGTIAPFFTGAGEAEVAAKVAPFIAKLSETIGVDAASLLPKVVSYLATKAPTVVKDTTLATAQTGSAQQGIETGVGGQVLSLLSKPISATGKALYKGLSIPTSAQEARLLQAYNANTPLSTRLATALEESSSKPITASETAFSKGLAGTESMIGTQAKRASSSLWEHLISPSLAKVEQKVPLSDFFDAAQQKIIKDNPELGRQNALLDALSAVKEDYNKPLVSFTELQDLKKGWAQFVPDKAYKGQPIAGAYNDVRNILAGEARTRIYDALGPEAKRAYIDYGNLTSLAEWGQKAMTGGKFKGGTGGLLSAMKDAVLTPIATVGGQAVYKIGQGMEFIGPPGARYLSDLFNEASQN